MRGWLRPCHRVGLGAGLGRRDRPVVIVGSLVFLLRAVTSLQGVPGHGRCPVTYHLRAQDNRPSLPPRPSQRTQSMGVWRLVPGRAAGSRTVGMCVGGVGGGGAGIGGSGAPVLDRQYLTGQHLIYFSPLSNRHTFPVLRDSPQSMGVWGSGPGPGMCPTAVEGLSEGRNGDRHACYVALVALAKGLGTWALEPARLPVELGLLRV